MKSRTPDISQVDRRSFIGGSDARVIMGDDEAALLRLWREKRGEVEPEDLSDNLVVQLGAVTSSSIANGTSSTPAKSSVAYNGGSFIP
jgi:predicted phage-related endonuclease